MKVGERIRELREKNGFTQNGLAAKAMVSQTHLRRVELGQADITVEHLRLVCDALSISLKDFFECDDEIDEFSATISHLTPKQKKLLMEFLSNL